MLVSSENLKKVNNSGMHKSLINLIQDDDGPQRKLVKILLNYD